MSSHIKRFIISSILFLVCLPEMALAVGESDFAYSAELRTTPGTPFFEMEIPEVVYENVTRQDLGDMRVLNGSGHVVPHGLRSQVVEKKARVNSASVAFFPLFKNEDEINSGLHLNIQRNDQGEIVDIKSHSEKNNKDARLSGYILDLRDWEQPVDKIRIGWDNSMNDSRSNSFIRKLNISTSDDLTHWRPVAQEQTLVNLSYQDHQLIEDMLNVSLGRVKYIRLLFADSDPGLELTDFEVIHKKSSQLHKQNWKRVSVNAGNTQGEYTFQHVLKTPLKKIRVHLPENNSVVNVKVMSRDSETNTWTYRGAGLVYRLIVDGVNIQHTEISVSVSRDVYWKLLVDQKGGGIGSDLPGIELAWKPQQLVFIARGEPPYKVVWGSARVEPVTQNAKQILVGVNQGNVASMLAKAEWIENSVITVNPESLTEVEKSVNWRQWLLWGVLVVAAILLIWMSIRLMNKMSEQID